MTDPGDPVSILKKEHGLNNSSLETISRIGIVSRIKIIRESGEGSAAKKIEKNFKVSENAEKHSMIWGMFLAVTMESAVFMGKNYLNNCHSIVHTTDLTLKQMFDISTKLVSEQDVISGLETNG